MFCLPTYGKNKQVTLSLILVTWGILLGSAGIDQYEVIIVGGGISGYSAAIYAGHARVNALLVSGPYPGGQLGRAVWVENIPGVIHGPGYEIMDLFHEQALEAGIQYCGGSVERIEPVDSGWRIVVSTYEGAERTMWAPALVIATGACPRLLDIPDIERGWGHGLSTCALCDKFIAQDKDIVVVGSGAGAAHEVIQLSPYARSITVIMRSDDWKETVSKSMREQLALIPMSVMPCATITDIIYDADSADISGVIVQTMQGVRSVHTQAIFLALGHVPASELVQPWVACTPEGFITVDRYGFTGISGLYAAGDVTDVPYRQAIVAAASGVVAVLQAIDYAQHTYLKRSQTIRAV